MSVISNSTLAGSSGQGGGAGYEIERSLRFNTSDEAHLSKTFSSAGNQKTWTWSSWVKLDRSNYQNLFANLVNNGTGCYCYFSSGNLVFTWDIQVGGVTTVAKYQDFSAWYHFVIVLDSTQSTSTDRVKIYVNGVQQTLTGLYPALNADSKWMDGNPHFIARQTNNYHYGLEGYLADVHFIDGQALAATDFGKYDTNNVWQPKEFTGTYGTNGFHLDFSDNSSDAALGTDASGNGNTWTVNNLTANAIDYASNYSLTGSLYAASYSPDKLFDGSISSAVLLLNSSSTLTYTFDTPIAFSSTFEVYYTNGVSATTMDINGVSQTIDDNYATREWLSASGITSPVTSLSWSGTNGANGPYVYAVRVDGNILIGAPASETDALRDSPTNGDPTSDTGVGGELSGNYCTWNPLAEQASGSITLSNGNLTATVGGTRSSFFGTMALEGKTYWEIVFTGGAYIFGMADASMFNTTANTSPNIFIGETSTSWSIGNDGTVYNNGAAQGTETSWTNGDVMGWSYDSSNGAIKIYKNGTLNGSYTASTANTYFPAATLISSGASVNVNFGQRAFSHPVSGYKALCTANLPDPTIADGSTAFDAKTFTANNGTQTISGFNFSPDLIWTKSRANAYAHQLWDQVRGTNKALSPNDPSAEANLNDSLAFTSDGFTSGTNNNANYGSGGSIAWAWDAGSSTVTNTDGSISAQVRANPSAGFSIVSYTGSSSAATVGHGLNAALEMIIVKDRDNGYSWQMAHVGIGADESLILNGTNTATDYNAWNASRPTSSVFSLGAGTLGVNTNGADLIAYCFAPVEGYSAFGSYTGNGVADGPFVYTGFRPAFILIKNSSATAPWYIYDSTRETFNPVNQKLYADQATAEGSGSGDAFDLLSNGFKSLAANSAGSNVSGQTFIYAAFAEHPFKTSRAR